jgi:hypothetical protein
MKRKVRSVLWIGLPITGLLTAGTADARPPIRRAFFDAYPTATGSRLDNLPSNPGHCGVCHHDFDGGGARNAYGVQLEVAIASGQYATALDAVLAIGPNDPDVDGYSSLVEVTDLTHFTNTPTFPGLTLADLGSVSHVATAEIQPYLTPAGSTDTTPPLVTVFSPNGGEWLEANTLHDVTWSATDASGIAAIDIYFSDDDGLSERRVAAALLDTGSWSWFVPNRPGLLSRIRVEARDNAGNVGSDESNLAFTIHGAPAGLVATTLRDFDLPGSQPLTGTVVEDPSLNCITCHGNYDAAVEPWHSWRGSMMGNAARDPLFLATMVVAEQDAPSSGDFCLRCHTPGGWLEGRSVDTSGGMLTAKDRQSVQCDFCHRQVDPDYEPGVSPPQDLAVLDALESIPPAVANGTFVTDPNSVKRGPFDDAQASHAFLASPLHRSSDLCGTCHDVSNPAFVATGSPGEYVPDAFDAAHPDADLRNMFPVERTYSEWSASEYAVSGVYAPQFAGTKPSGIVSTCQDCHMRDAEGRGCSVPGAPSRTDLPLHDMTGGNTFVTDILADFYPAEVDVDALASAKGRATELLTKAAGLDLAATQVGPNPAVQITVTNETAHKLPSGYPEGRRIWLNVRGYDAADALVYESGAYDFETGTLAHDSDLTVYEVKPGISQRLGAALGVTSGPSFHFVLNDTIWSDNRIPPRGFTNAAFTAIQSPPVGRSYADGQYWDERTYVLPSSVERVGVTLYYQTTSREYVEFLRDANTTNTLGQELYDAWVARGRSAPVVMAGDEIELGILSADESSHPTDATVLRQARPNPFAATTTIGFTLARRGTVSLTIFDVRGRRVATLVERELEPGAHAVSWPGVNDYGMRMPPGRYFARLRAEGRSFQQTLDLVP